MHRHPVRLPAALPWAAALPLAAVLTLSPGLAGPARAASEATPPRSPYAAGRPLSLFREFDYPDRAAPGRGVPSDFLYARFEPATRDPGGYLNLTVNGVWVIRNLSLAEWGASRWIEVSPGPLGEQMSAPVRFGYSLDAAPRRAAPPQTDQVVPAPLPGPKCGLGGGGPGKGKAGGGEGLIQAGDALKDKMHVHAAGFPNQPAKINQCLSVAFSNSLTWLNDTQALKLPKADITPDGVDGVVKRPAGKPAAYAASIKRKRDKFAGKIDTIALDASGLAQLPKAIDKGCDVELMANPASGEVGHVVSVTGVGQQKNGKWRIDIVEDLKQGPVTGDPAKDAGTHQLVPETIVYPTGNKQISGPKSGVDGYQISVLVIECKKGTDLR